MKSRAETERQVLKMKNMISVIVLVSKYKPFFYFSSSQVLTPRGPASRNMTWTNCFIIFH